MPGMNRGDNLEEIYAWIDELPFSKPKKNISRDFSDGVLMAEVLKIHYPRFADVHNYIPANNVAAKRENWNTLNRKVFSKIDMKLSKEVINQLANAQPGIIENVLIDLRNKIFTKDVSSIGEENPIKIQSHGSFVNDPEKTEESTADSNIIHKQDLLSKLQTPEKENYFGHQIIQKDEETSSSKAPSSTVIRTSSSYVSVTKSTRNLIGKACSWLISWMWPFSRSAKTVEKELSSPSPISAELLDPPEKSCSGTDQQLTSNGNEDEDEEASEISRLDFLRLRQEVQEKNLAIIMLNRKVSRLESAMKLKDQKIGNLAAQISSSSTDTAQNLRPHVMGSSVSRLQYQTKSCNKSIS